VHCAAINSRHWKSGLVLISNLGGGSTIDLMQLSAHHPQHISIGVLSDTTVIVNSNIIYKLHGFSAAFMCTIIGFNMSSFENSHRLFNGTFDYAFSSTQLLTNYLAVVSSSDTFNALLFISSGFFVYISGTLICYALFINISIVYSLDTHCYWVWPGYTIALHYILLLYFICFDINDG